MKVAAGFVVALSLLVLLKIGQDILMPAITALLAIYVVNGAARVMERVPFLGTLSETWRGITAMFVLTLLVLLLSLMLAGSVQDVISAAPAYEDRLAAVFASVAGQFGADPDGLWGEIQHRIGEWVDVQALFKIAFESLSSVGALLFMSVLYAFFMLAERYKVRPKIFLMFGDRMSSESAFQAIETINENVTLYLGLKTLINIILGILSLIVLVFFGVDFALLWALLIGLLNFVPYVGSFVGVALPVILAIAQFGNVATPALLCVLLIGTQILIGNIIEPRLMGKRLNLSPLVVLLSLAFWSSLWGIPGAILAVPLTSVITIVASRLPPLNWIAILLADDVEMLVDGRKDDRSGRLS